MILSPLGVCSVSNQGSVSGSMFTTVLTDDPSVVGPANPTVTPLQIAPTITICQTNIMTNTDPDLCSASESFAATAVGCPAPTLTYRIGMTVITSPHVFPIGTTTVDVTASNGNLPNATCSFTVTVTDNQAPTITCPVGPFNRGTNLGNCNYTVQGTEFNPSFSDNCPGAVLTNDVNGAASLAGAVLSFGSNLITWTITDANNNTNTCSITVEVSDDDAPLITCPGPATTPCDINDLPPYADLTAFTSAGGIVNDNCGIDNGSFMYLGQTVLVNVYTRTYQISDINGNMASCTQTVTVNDVTPPVITPGSVASCYATVAALEAAAISTTTAMDNCPGTLTFTASTSGTCVAVVTVTVTDAAGNSASTMYNSRVDNTPPTITAGAINSCYNSVALAEAAALAATSAMDNCPGTITYSASTAGSCTAIITITATDFCSNASTTTYSTVIDDSDPVITVTGTIAACYPTAAAAEAAAIAATTAIDNCPGSLVYTASTAGDCAAIITVTVTDGCSRTDQTTYSTRIDNTPPVITTGTIATCYPTLAAAESAALAATSAMDNCSGPVTYGVSTAGDCSAIVTVTATDGCGNQSSTTYNTRIDNTAPVSTAGTIAACYPTVAAAEAAALAATSAMDNCPGVLTESASTIGTCAAIITVTTTDGCGNSSSVTYNTIIDNTPPVITTGTIGTCYPTVAAAEAAALAATTALDNCLGTVSFSAGTSGTCAAIVTITATDFCGNFSTTTYNTRIDNTAPPVTQGSIATCYPTVAAAEAAALAATSATDNCPGTLTETVSTTGTCSAVITVTTTDGCGNSANVIYNTTIDNAGPTVMKGSIATCYPTAAIAEAAAITATGATDDCPSSLTFTAATVGTCSAVVTVTVTDGCGNTASTTYDTRIDNTPPTVTIGNIAPCYATAAEAEAAALAATSATDNCPGPLTETVSTSGDCLATITVTTTDGCGNSISIDYTTRIDNTPPIVTQGSIASCYPTVAAAEAAALAATTATDNCSGPLFETASTSGTCAAIITVTTTDGCGNSSTTTYNTRIDNTNPVITTDYRFMLSDSGCS
ncbi:MAG: HYR domain-containing protein [Saprospiraceae bacterium]|nr:HYR domain-containing protein [Saprospiraceae bacterium]